MGWVAELGRVIAIFLALSMLTIPPSLANSSGVKTESASIDWSPGPLVLVNDEITFTTDASGDEFLWTFPDGSTETGRTVTHHFSAPGDQTVELAIEEDGETTATEQATVTVQRYYTRDQVVKKQAFIPVDGTMDLEAEYNGTDYLSTSEVAPEGTPLLNDPVYIDATLYYPDPEIARGPWPAILATHGGAGHKSQYEGFGESFAEEGVGAYAQEGYVGVVYNFRGTGNTSGYTRAFDPDQEIADARQLITWLADDDAHDGDTYDNRGYRPNVTLDFQVEKDAPGDPRVGMFGQSAAGITTMLTTGQDDRVDAAAPGGIYHSLYDSLLPGDVPKSVLTAGLIASRASVIGTWQLDRGNYRTWSQHPEIWGSLDTEIPFWTLQAYTGVDEEMRQDWQRRSPETYNPSVTAPVFLAQGWKDHFHPPEALNNYEQLANNPYFSSLSDAERDRQLKLVMQPSGHDFYEHKVQDMRVLWFNHHLKGHALDATYRGVVDRYNGDNPEDRANIVTLPAVDYSYVVEQPPILFHENNPNDTRRVSLGEPQGEEHPPSLYDWFDDASRDRWINGSEDHWYDPYTGFDYRAYDEPIWTDDTSERFYLRGDNQLSTTAPTAGPAEEPPDVIANVPGPGWTTKSAAGAQSGTPFEELDHAPVATVSYQGPVLEEDVTVIGKAQATLDVVLTANGPLTSGMGNVHFAVKVWDEAPDGELELATRGYKAVGLEDLAQGQGPLVREVTVPLFALDRVFPEGHRMVVQVTHSDVTYVMPSLVPHLTAIRHTEADPSYVDLPVRETPGS